MLKNWTTHAEYQQFIISNISSFYKAYPKKIEDLETSISKLFCLDLDILGEILKPYHSNTGRPATLQPEIFRSFSLMLFQKETSITRWVSKLHADALFSTCIGCTNDSISSLGAHYDFMITNIHDKQIISNLNIKIKSLTRIFDSCINKFSIKTLI